MNVQIPQIRIESQFAKNGMETVPARQSIQQPDANLHIEQPLADMKMRTIPGRLTIDQSKAWEDMDIKGIFQRVKENAERGKQKLLEGISRVAREGDEMLDIHSGRDVLVEQAKQKANPPPIDTNITWVPSPFSVKIHYEPGKTNIQFQPRKPVIDANVRKPIISYTPGDVNIYMRQQNSLKIDFVK
ncbi:DUF6470 family protein [Lederbergia wuyishanensis]|uniref:YviE n=1 Tax=Lederbergia wuyishanensis TaxID=1347903 RepID=A0ABU0D8R8_9BACI|nr:DUF6470 family protein [Lederbergia wuyishanensis]MCJ8007595.1 DUF6470 family protein [Lederbergia wuyishanensis]MDQ0344822.1 hypothetical protein [Lederbergia wuyishanensis]